MAASKEDPRIRNLRIKTGILKRLVKEKAMYEKEVSQHQAKIETMKQEGQEEFYIKKQGELLLESQTMIPDTQRRMQAAHDNLKTLMSEDWSGFTEDGQYKAAQQLLDETKELEQS